MAFDRLHQRQEERSGAGAKITFTEQQAALLQNMNDASFKAAAEELTALIWVNSANW